MDVEPLNFLDVSNGLQISAGVVGSCFVMYHAYNFFYPREVERETKRETKLETNVVEEVVEKKKKAIIDMD